MTVMTGLPVGPALPATLNESGTVSTGETILFAVVSLITVVCGLGLLTAKRAVLAAANMIGIMICLAITTSTCSFNSCKSLILLSGS